MNLSLDYDATFTEDPDGWVEVMKIMRARGHTVYGVTMRYPTETSDMDRRYQDACDKIFFTGRKAKQPFMAERGVRVHVWLDDMPQWVLNDAG